MANNIRVAVVNDWYGSVSGTPEEEAQGIIDDLLSFDLPAELVFQSTTMHGVSKRDDIDLLIIDYGGLSVAGGGDSTASVQVWSALNWAENHPGKMVILWTAFTCRVYDRELASQFGHMDNVFLNKGYDYEPVREQLRRWYASYLL